MLSREMAMFTTMMTMLASKMTMLAKEMTMLASKMAMLASEMMMSASEMGIPRSTSWVTFDRQFGQLFNLNRRMTKLGYHLPQNQVNTLS